MRDHLLDELSHDQIVDHVEPATLKRHRTEQVIPPYLPFSTLIGFIDSMAANGLPLRIQAGMLKGMSWANQSWTLASLRFLRLTTEDNRPTEKFKRLVSADGDDRMDLFGSIIVDAYPFIFQAEGFDIATATPEQLDEQFERAGAVGDTKKKSVRFFLHAAKHSGLELSPHLDQIRLRTKAIMRRRKFNAAAEGITVTFDRDKALLEKIPEFNPEWSEETLNKWLDLINKLMDRK